MSNQNAVYITTPAGRLVSGDPYFANDKDAKGNPLLIKSGTNAGQPRVNYYIGIAIPKDGRPWEQTEWGMPIITAAKTGFSGLFDQATGQLLPGRKIAFKVDDGDSQEYNDKGKRNCDKEGYAGHWIMHWSDGFPPTCVDANGKNVLLEPVIKRGHFIQINGTVKANGDLENAGVFLNPKFIAHTAYGEEIITGPSAEDAGFGGVNLPAGASATPIGGMNTGGQQQQNHQHQQETTQQTTQQTTQTTTVTPANDLVTPGNGKAPPSLPGAATVNKAPPQLEQMYIYDGAPVAESVLLSWEGWTPAHVATLVKV